MNRELVEKTVIDALGAYLEIFGEEITITPQTELIGHNAVIKSIGLVMVIADIEARLSEHDMDVLILSEKAMSSVISPFRNVGALTNFIVSQLEEAK